MDAEAPRDTWTRVLGKIEDKIGAHPFNTWFRPTRLVDESGAHLTVRVPNDLFAEWLQTNYRKVIRDALDEIGRSEASVAFRPDPVAAPPVAEEASAPARRPTPSLNPRYSFDSFVVSSCNQFAHAAARAVAEKPSRAYNPLYLYGGVGLGKTHLMQAIGNHLGSRLRLQYVSSEQFMNDLINAIRFEKTLEFKDNYRSVDLLLIDDIQFLAGKERTQEELFHTFNALHDAQKQIVITSDVPPRDIPKLEERLRSRFEWGLIADLQPPDLETKIAILRKKAEAEGTILPHDIALFVASKCTSNIRELEGVLVRVLAWASMSKREITLELAREALRDLTPTPTAVPTAEDISKLVAEHFNMKVSVLKSKNNRPAVAQPRQIAMYLCKQLTPASLPEIGRRFAKHHTTVMHSIQKVEDRRTQDRDFDRLVEHLMSALK